MNTRSLLSISLASLLGLLPACRHLPPAADAKATKANKGAKLPADFDAPSSPELEVAKGLRSLFSDPQLNSYVSQALYSNPTLKASLARLEEAGFNTRKASAPGLPSLIAGVNGARRGTDASHSGLYSASLDAQWEVDVWGRIRASVKASARNQAAIAADHEATRQSITAQTMQAYFSLIRADKLLGLSQRRLSSFEKTKALVKRRFESGLGQLSELDLARTDVENTRAQVEQRKNSRDQVARQLSALTGSYPDAKKSAHSWPSLRRSVPAGIPSTVMMGRPDVIAAFERIRAADSRAKVAHRDLYPRFSLTGSAGRQSSILRKLADANFSVWSIAANLAAPLMDGGSRRSELGSANARAKKALANYHTTVLSAFQEVENALGSAYYLKNQQHSYQRALTAAKSAESRIQSNYENGLVEILTLLDAQRRSFSTEESLINTKSLRYQNRVSLALALGKGL